MVTQSKQQPEAPQAKDKTNAGRRLGIHTTVTTERGPVTYKRGDVPASEHLEFITNPDVWAEDESQDNS